MGKDLTIAFAKKLKEKIASLREENKRLYSLLGCLANVKSGDENIFEWLDDRDCMQQETGAKKMAEIALAEATRIENQYDLFSDKHDEDTLMKLWRENINK